MKNIIILLIFINCHCKLIGQTNLVRNYSFENNTFTYPCINSPTPHYDILTPSNSVSQTDLTSYWNNIEAWDVPTTVGGCVGTASPDCLCENGFARTGLFYGRHVNREYIVQNLSSTILQGHYFYYEFYIKGFQGGYFENVGIKLFDEKPRQCKYNKLNPNSNTPPQIMVTNVLKDGNWNKVTGIMLANQNYSWISLGTYGGDHGDGAFWDDIRIYDLGTSTCPSNWLFENTIFENIGIIYQATDKIIAGENVDPISINGPVIVKSNSSVIFKAVNQVVLEPGFSTEIGAYFETAIEGCSPNICPYFPPPLNDVIICDDNPVTIGSSGAETGLFYSWSPSTYLDDPNSSNPVFIPPSGSGIINYTVTITSICGSFINFSSFPPQLYTSINENVQVYYNTNPDPNPSVSITNLQTSDYDFSFDFIVGTETEEYCIKISEQGTGAIAYSNCFEISTGSCCNYTFNYDMLTEFEKSFFSTCKDYTIEITSKNYCFDNLAYDQFDWNRDGNLSLISISNVISIPYPPNEYFTVSISGADDFHVVIFNPNGGEVHNETGYVTSSPLVLWDGWCDGANCALFFGQECWVINGTYFYTLELTNDCGGQFNTSGNLTIFHDQNNLPCVRSTLIINDSIENSDKELTNQILIYPNPTNGIFEINIPDELTVDKISLYDNTGRIVCNTNNNRKIDLSSFSNGIYFLEINTDQGIFREKIIKN